MNEEKIPIFTVPDIVKFLEWAYDRYRVEGVIMCGEEAMVSIIYEYLDCIKIK